MHYFKYPYAIRQIKSNNIKYYKVNKNQIQNRTAFSSNH